VCHHKLGVLQDRIFKCFVRDAENPRTEMMCHQLKTAKKSSHTAPSTASRPGIFPARASALRLQGKVVSRPRGPAGGIRIGTGEIEGDTPTPEADTRIGGEKPGGTSVSPDRWEMRPRATGAKCKKADVEINGKSERVVGTALETYCRWPGIAD
jgi:hypothetical protein